MAAITCISGVAVRQLQCFRTNLLKESSSCIFQQVRCITRKNYPRLRQPIWFMKKERTVSILFSFDNLGYSFFLNISYLLKLKYYKYEEHLTPQNKTFIKDVVESEYGPPAIIGGVSIYQQSPLKVEPMERGTWKPGCRRTGLIARKIGVYPMWLKDGKKVLTTLLQVIDNHVIRYIPPEEFNPPRLSDKCPRNYISSVSVSICLFPYSGLMPKKMLSRFLISPEAAIQPGTPLYASHFKVGDYVDVRGKTVFRDFQGVVVRWGFKGMPASHGVTKTHRRPGNIGSGGEKARVWPGQKMPGHMGNRFRVLKGLKGRIVNTKYNIIWVMGGNVAGETNTFVHIYDTILPLRRFEESPYFPTYYPEDQSEPLPEELYADDVK
ncbi:hypothetical protein L9F63_013876, partial [Diploptera punctata]